MKISAIIFVLFLIASDAVLGGSRHILRVPDGHMAWLLAETPPDAASFLSTEFDVAEKAVNSRKWPTYQTGAEATLLTVRGDYAEVRLESGENRNETGWVVKNLVELSPGEKKRLANEAAKSRRKQEMSAKLPKLTGSPQVVVATSLDCARDLRKAVEFGKSNGTGVEFRKKMLELARVGCTTSIPSGTSIIVTNSATGLISFKIFDSTRTGVALAENVDYPQHVH